MHFCSDHKLSPNFLKLISRPQLAQLHFDTESFVRDGVLFTFLTQILKSFNEVELKFDAYLTKEIWICRQVRAHVMQPF